MRCVSCRLVLSFRIRRGMDIHCAKESLSLTGLEVQDSLALHVFDWTDAVEQPHKINVKNGGDHHFLE